MVVCATKRQALRLAVVLAGTAPLAAAAAEVIEVQRGDTFSAIAARYTGSVRQWKTLYDARASGLANPNRIVPGMHFELVEADGRRYLRLLGDAAAGVALRGSAGTAGAAGTAAAAGTASAEAAPAVAAPALPPPDTFVVGVLPNIGATALMAQYESLKHYLERNNPQQVRIVLPASFRAFYEGLMKGEYDLAVAAPHFARVAQSEGRGVPLALYEPRIGAQLVVAAGSPIASGRELRGKTVAFANAQSLVAMYGRQWLREQQLDEGRDYTVKPIRTDMGVGRMLLTGEVDAAIMSNGEFRSLPPDESARLEVREVFARIPNFVVIGQPRLGQPLLDKLKAQLLAFPADAEDGAAFAKATGIGGIVAADEAQLRELDAYVAATRRAMTAPPN